MIALNQEDCLGPCRADAVGATVLAAVSTCQGLGAVA